MQLMPAGLSRSCSAFVMRVCSVMAPAHDLVRRCLEHATGVVVARPDAGHVPTGRHEPGGARGGVEDLGVGPVERRELRVVAGLVHPPVLDLLRVEVRRRVEDGDPVAHQLAVRDDRELHRLEALAVDRPGLEGSHQVGYSDHGDLVDRLQAAEPGALRDVPDVVVRAEAGFGCRLGWGDQGGSALGGLAHGRAGLDLLERDHLGVGVDPGRDVGVPLGDRDVVEGLGLGAVDVHDQLELVLGWAVAAGLGHFERDVLPGRRADGCDGVAAERRPRRAGELLLGAAPRHGALGRLGPLRGDPAADPHDERGAAAVLHVAVHGVREVAVRLEVTERLGELGPVGDQGRLVERALLGEAHEGGDGGAHPLDGARPGLDLFDVDTGRQIVRHAPSSGGPWAINQGSERWGMPGTSVSASGRVSRPAPSGTVNANATLRVMTSSGRPTCGRVATSRCIRAQSATSGCLPRTVGALTVVSRCLQLAVLEAMTGPLDHDEVPCS